MISIVRAAVLVVLLARASLLAAEMVTFDPSIQLEQGYVENVDYSEDEGSSDTIHTVRATLPYARESETGRLSFSYSPSYVRQEEFTKLDRDEHRVDLGWDGALTRINRFGAKLYYQRTQDQGTPEAVGDPDLFLTRRTDRDLARADVTFRRSETPRWTWDARAGAASYDYSEIEGFAGDVDSDVEDRVQHGGGVGVSRSLSRESSIGMRFDYEHFDLDVSGEQDSSQLGVTYDKRLGSRLSLFVSAGAFRGSGDTLGSDRQQSGAMAEARLSRLYERFRLDVQAAHQPSSGGALEGTAIQSSLGLVLTSQSRRRPWRWQVAPRFSSRNPSGGGETIDGYGIRGFIERGFGRLYALRLNSDHFDQSNGGSAFEAALAFLWYPLGESELAGRGR